MTMSSEDQRSPWSSALRFHWRVLKQAVARFGAQEVPTRAETAAYVLFAMRQGVVVKNDLPDLAAPAAEVEPERKGWMAYTPPPAP